MLSINPLAASYAIHNADAAAVDARREQVALKAFEQQFVYQLLREMRKTVMKSDMLKSYATDTYEEMLDESLSEGMAESGQLGIARMVADQLAIERRQHQIRNQLGLTPAAGAFK